MVSPREHTIWKICLGKITTLVAAVHIFQFAMVLTDRLFPSSQRRGGCAIKRNVAKRPKRRRRGGQTGATFRRTSIEASPYRARASRHPKLAHCSGGL